MAHVLVVDDEKGIRITLQAFLERDGHEVKIAEDSASALDLLRENEFDVVVSDIVLPKMTGVELLESIRKLSEHVQVILITGEPTLETASSALRLGAIDYLAKPVDRQSIVRSVRNAARTKALIDDKLRLEKENQIYQNDLEYLVELRTKSLHENEKKYRSLFENMLDGFALHEIITDENGLPIDYFFIEVNNAFETQTGLKRENISGKRVTEILPGIKDDPANWIGIYGEVALENQQVRFEQYSDQLKKWYSVLAFSPKENHFATIFTDITERKNAEVELKDSRELMRNLTAHVQNSREDERTAIAREIHDELGQALTAMVIDISRLEKKFLPAQNDLCEITASMKKLINNTSDAVDRISSDLRPGLLDDLGLVDAIEWQVREFEKRMDIICETSMSFSLTNLDRDINTALYRITQEALTNIARHSQATKVKICFTDEGEQIILKINDNGIGVTRKQIADSMSFGLHGMKERTQYFGGTFDICGTKGSGTEVTVTFPAKLP
jgi:PAS domain S-box-containing protein